MKSFIVPDTVKLTHPETGLALEEMPSITFRQYALRVWAPDERGIIPEGEQTQPEAVARWGEVIRVIKGCSPGDCIQLEDQDYSRLLKIVQRPKLVFGSPMLEVQCIDFPLAVINAKK